MTVLEHIKNLSHALTPDQRRELSQFLRQADGKSQEKSPASLRGSWKIALPEDFDLDSSLREIRSEWKRELDFDL